MSVVVPAPGEERFLSLALVNTVVSGTRGSVERLGDREALASWLEAHRVQGAIGPQDAAGRESLTALRSTLRYVFSAHITGQPLDPKEVGRLNDTAATVAVVPSLRLDGVDGLAAAWGSPSGDDDVEAAISRDAINLLTSPSAARLRECAADDCDRLFLQDHGRRRWCSQACGDRTRAARHYAKVRQTKP
jgi:predicted RNA-binding Zn ribbon-like protein